MNTLQATRKEDMLWMRSQGYTLKEIGEHYGLSKQRVEQILPKLYGPSKPSHLVYECMTIGQFGKWSVLGVSPLIVNSKNRNGCALICRCTCGKITSIRAADLLNRSTSECRHALLPIDERY